MSKPTAQPASNSSRPGSQSALRQRNEQLIIATLREQGSLSQANLARATGLSTATISNIVKALCIDGLAATAPTTSSGRRALAVSLLETPEVVAGIDFGRSHVRLVLASPAFKVKAEKFAHLPVGHLAGESIATAAAMLEDLLVESGISRNQVAGAGVGVPGPIDHRTGTVIRGAILPEWVGVNIVAQLEAALTLPVFADNDANLGALAQITWGEHRAAKDLMFLKIGSGIGAGLILNGAPYYGHTGITGEIGHSTIFDQGLVCRCGNRGCLETVASTAIMIELLSRGEAAPLTVSDIIGRAKAGDAATLRVIDDAGMAVGKAVANVANMINPEMIVVGGPLAPLGETLLAPIRRGLVRHAVPAVGEGTAVLMSSLGDRAEALGAISLALTHGRHWRQ
ncbi:transcriptional regulator/sugar kinase [Arthrobacter sp. PAMC 25486]|uniref:ROK family transcriptional regulator n=1 Tax=Arthrobacter sp. PAMC 25486 TaxID=1494608 RepID=UPI0005363581|nr:ROK family transcriptional regulator [Arthrobacter sp. PAMC 25486]AIY03477.1 transcriptional regulator/sugar kinase [Arthrobacter sp. PAMC 25486]